MAGIEEAFEKFVTRVSGREKSRAEQPLSKYKSYSEQELLENIEAKYPNQLQSFSQEDYQLNTMPMFEPKDVAPPKSYSPMPVEKYLKGREYMDLAEGGLSNLIKNNIAPEYRLYTRTMVPGLKTGKLDENYFPDDFKLDLRKQALDKYSKTGELSGIVDEMDQHASRTKKNKLIRFPSTYAALGTYSYEIDPKTLDVKVKDKYDWNPAYGTQGNFTGFVGNEPEKGGRDVDASILKDYAVNTMKRGIDIPAGLELFGNLLGPRSSKGEGVDIDINIPTEVAAMRADTPYADGGVASMFRERPGYQEGGSLPPSVMAPSGIEYELVTGQFSGTPRYRPKYDPLRSDIVYNEMDPEEFFKSVMTTGTSVPTTTEVPTIPQTEMFPTISYDPIGFSSGNPNQKIVTKEILDQTFGNNPYTNTDLYNRFGPEISMQLEGNFPTTIEVPTVDPFSGQQVSMQDQMAFAQPQADIFPQQNIPQPPSPVDQFIGERRFQAEADAAARSGIPFTKTIQDFIGNLYSGPEIANMQEQTFGTSNLSGDTGIVSDLRHATAASQVRDKIANAVSMNYFNPAGILPQSLGLFGSQVLGAANEIQSIRPNMQSMRDIGEDLRANFYGATQVPYGQSATTTYNQLLNNPSLPSAQMRSQQEASARVMPTRMSYGGRVSMSDGGLTTMIAPAKGPDSQGVESLFRRRYN